MITDLLSVKAILMDPYVCAHTHTHYKLDRSVPVGVYVCVLTRTASFPSRCVTTAQHCGSTKERRITPFIQRLYGVSMAMIHRHRPIDPVEKKRLKNIKVVKIPQSCFILSALHLRLKL